ncbi:hypothetical protein WBG99_03840 [Streptomyces sp. TG1A-60]|uniref:hypothetical protein n=1 Tax=Streptomyces sp. TG1A-60 TaxID=3129111 RepID=UPI0030CE0AAB
MPLIGVAGCGLVVALPAGALVLMFVVGRMSVPAPEGEPLAINATEVTGTWVDEQGGRLVLKGDGTFASDGVCGDFDDDQLNDVSAPDPGAGTWEHDTWDDLDTDSPVSKVHLTFAPSGVWTGYEARGTSKAPLLWTYAGDPDSGDLCVPGKAAK